MSFTPTRSRITRWLSCALAAGASLAAAARAAGPAPRCDSHTALTLVGVDTRDERVLLAPPVTAGEAGWLIELDLTAGKATAWPEAAPGARFAGSTGPGAILAASRCGAQCLQVLRFTGGRWEPLGGTILAPPTATVHLTWDREGAPWVVLHGRAGKAGIAAEAYRLERHEWVSKGSLSVANVGEPGALPAPAGESGIVSGDGQFTPDGHPHRWLATPPKGAAEGELLWLGGKDAAFLGPDALLEVEDGGRAWQPVRWLPWAGGEGDLAWKPGRDYWVELPDGERAPPLVAIWNDVRAPASSRIYLARREPGGEWKTALALPPGILTTAGERLPFNHLVRVGGDRWLLLSGCVARAEGPALALREVVDGKLRDPRLLAIEAAP